MITFYVCHYIAVGAELEAKRLLWPLPKRALWKLCTIVKMIAGAA